MPDFGMGFHQELRQELRQALRQVQRLEYPGGPEAFRTDEEQVQVSQYELLQKLLKLVEAGEYFDPDHFSLEINRAVFGHPVEARLGNFGRDVTDIVRLYDADDITAKKIIALLGAQKEDQERKDVPGQIAAAWNKARNSDYFGKEPQQKELLFLVDRLHAQQADIADAMDALAITASNGTGLTASTLERIRDYTFHDVRIIPFMHGILAPVIRSLNKRGEALSKEDGNAVYRDVIESLYMLDRDLRVGTTIPQLCEQIERSGLLPVLQSKGLPLPIQVALRALQPAEELYHRIVSLCTENDFVQGREVKRGVYQGIAGLQELGNGCQILNHLAQNAESSKGLAKLLGAVNLVRQEPQFNYQFDLTGEQAILAELRSQLVDKSIRRLGVSRETLQQYLERLESDEQFRRIGTIITTLAGYSHYQNAAQTGLLREIVEAELAGKIGEWRYTHDRAAAQLAVLDGRDQEWRENKKVTRLVGELDALKAHIDSIKNVLPKMLETYTEHYKQEFKKETVQELEAMLISQQEQLRKDISPKEKRELGYQAGITREHLGYAKLLAGLQELSTENYQGMLDYADKLARTKSKNPLYEGAKWVREVLDQPVYRDARRIQVVETDDLETLLRFGETPVPHCQNWKVDSTYNRTLLSFVADANKKLYHIINGNEKPISMSMVRLIDWNGTPTLLAENVYHNEWSEDYGIALLGSLADKALDISETTGNPVHIATNHDLLEKAMKRFTEKYDAEMSEANIQITPPHSKNPCEYWDCGPGIVTNGTPINLQISYLTIHGKS